MLTLSISGFLTNRKDQGGGGSAPLVIWLSEGIFVIFSTGDLVLDVKDQNQPLYELIEDTLLFILDTQLSLRCFQCLIYFENNSIKSVLILLNIPKNVLFISPQQNIAQRMFCIQNEREGITSFKDCFCNFLKS